MQTILRVLNIVLSPVFTLLFTARLGAFKIAGRDAGDAIGAALAALAVLAIELVLTQGPKHAAWLRRWLDPRAAFEGIWLQDVLRGTQNRIGVISMSYERESDSFGLKGQAYSANGRPWARWNSTHMFIDRQQLAATYRWEGDVIGEEKDAVSEKSGITEMSLRTPPAFSSPMIGEGKAVHVDENRRIKFDLRRVTSQMLRELALPFTLRELQLNAHDEESRLVTAYLRSRSVTASLELHAQA